MIYKVPASVQTRTHEHFSCYEAAESKANQVGARSTYSIKSTTSDILAKSLYQTPTKPDNEERTMNRQGILNAKKKKKVSVK